MSYSFERIGKLLEARGLRLVSQYLSFLNRFSRIPILAARDEF